LSDPAEVIRGLRERVFTVAPSEVGVTRAASRTNVWAVIMEFAQANAVISLVAIADGTTSLYFSVGGGVIGAGGHPAVRLASERLIVAVDSMVDALSPVKDHPHPAVGRVRFYARTFDGLRGAEADEGELSTGGHVLSRLFAAGHGVIAAIRESKGG